MPKIKLKKGFELFYEKSGSGPNILLLHCLGLDHSIFDAQRAALANAGYCVITPDTRGHGRSDKLEEPCTLYDIVSDFEDFLECLGVSSLFALGGLSMGGMQAMRWALKNPGIAKALLLMGTSADLEEGRAQYEPMISMVERSDDAQKPQIYATLSDFIVRLCFTEDYLRDEKIFSRWNSIALANQGAGSLQVSIAVIRRDSVLDKISEIKMPTLIMVGEKDAPLPPRHAENMRERIKHSQLHVVADAGHVFSAEKPDETSAEILRFLKTI